jgi:hypothetical protein
MVFTTEIEIAAFVGAIAGCLVGTLGPYYSKKKELGWNDVDIFFDKKFLKATVVAVILAVIGVGGSFPTILANVPSTASVLTTLITSAVLAMTLNIGGNIVVGPSKITKDAEHSLMTKKATMIFTDVLDSRISDQEKMRSMRKVVENNVNKTPGVYKCDCPTCKDSEEVVKKLKDDVEDGCCN